MFAAFDAATFEGFMTSVMSPGVMLLFVAVSRRGWGNDTARRFGRGLLLLKTSRTEWCFKFGAMTLCGVNPLCDAVLCGKVAVIGLWGVVVFRHLVRGEENEVVRGLQGGI
jgi:hypothetical protein